MLVASFVDSAPLFDLLNTPNNQVIYGRRGTGKTHALKFLSDQVAKKGGETGIYIDLRSIGSNSSIYSDGSRPLVERASTLLLDVLGALSNEFMSLALAIIERHPNPDEVTRRLDRFQEAIATVRVTGDVEIEKSESAEASKTATLKLESPDKGFVPKASTSTEINQRQAGAERTKRIGREIAYLNFGNISSAVGDLMEILKPKRLWLLIDEWSEVPVDLQPYLADLLRRTLLPVHDITIKIAAIEHRSNFAIRRERGEYVGLELGADISADLNLDDFLVFDNNQERATHFVKTLIFKHYQSSHDGAPTFATSEDLIRAIFTQWPAFEEFVRAVEGVPRDALNLAAKIATKSFGNKMSVNHVRAGALDWYTQDKSAAIRSSPDLTDLLTHIVDNVIAGRRARAFMLRTNATYDGVEKLFDARLLHILKRNVSAHDRPGERFDVYKIDYGCYVDLINTTKAPSGLLIDSDDTDHTDYPDVPKDDYRSIRRAILELPEES